MRPSSRFAALVTAAAVGLAVTACGDSGEQTNTASLEPATAAVSPTGTAQPAGTVLPAPEGTELAAAGSTVAVLDGDGVRLYVAPGALDTPAPRTVATPPLTALTADGTGFVGAGPEGVTTIAADGTVTSVAVALTEPRSVAVRGEQVLVGTGDGRVVVLDRAGAIVREIGGFSAVDEILVAPAGSSTDGQVVVVDRARSMMAPVKLEDGEHLASLRAGNGVTQAVVDPAGRILASNTRDGEILGFYGQPIVMRFRYPVPQSPYALTYDAVRNVLWVATTADNQAVAYDLASGMPVERGRFATVGQVTAMTSAAGSGLLYLLSGRGDGLQAVSPQLPDAGAPAETAPAETTPAETTPAETTPAETAPTQN